LLPVIIEKYGQAILELGKPEMAIDHYSKSIKKLSRFVSQDDQALRWIEALMSYACLQDGQIEKGKSLLREASKRTFSSKEDKQSDFLDTGHWSIDTQFEIKKATSLLEKF
jgi:lipopolysaccharide biosynthesis regulator YciM